VVSLGIFLEPAISNMRRNEITRMSQKQLPNIGEHDLTSKKLSADEYTSTSISSSPVAIGSGASLTSLSWDGWTHSFTTYALMVRTAMTKFKALRFELV